ncbi:SHD1 domain-containing protein [Pontiellaceae bacterium B12227]|nr:SHD1 domain-containing protein [Pontiellaceae bacterium B12227]
MKIKLLFFVFCMALVVSTSAETRIWNLKNGKTIEAELQAVMGGKVSLKTLRGRVVKILEEDLSADDLSFIELNMPPKLDLSFSKTSKVRVFPESLSDLPSSQYFNFRGTVKQKSNKPYRHDLQMELFIIGEEKAGDKFILLDYQKETFRLEEGSSSVFELKSRQVELIEFEMNGQLRGEVYRGYMMIVTDSRGEVIAYTAKREEWYQNVENLRKVPIGKYFDNDCNRAWPTSPKRFY